MGKKRSNSKDTHKKAKIYSDILLFEATGGTIGKPLMEGAISPAGITFSEKRGLLDSLIKIATLDHKVNPEEEESVFDTIKRNKIDDGKVDGSEND